MNVVSIAHVFVRVLAEFNGSICEIIVFDRKMAFSNRSKTYVNKIQMTVPNSQVSNLTDRQKQNVTENQHCNSF